MNPLHPLAPKHDHINQTLDELTAAREHVLVVVGSGRSSDGLRGSLDRVLAASRRVLAALELFRAEVEAIGGVLSTAADEELADRARWATVNIGIAESGLADLDRLAQS